MLRVLLIVDAGTIVYNPRVHLDHMTNMQSMRKWHPTIGKYSYILVILVHEGSYDNSVAQGSCTEEKGIVLIKVSTFVNLPLRKKKQKMVENKGVAVFRMYNLHALMVLYGREILVELVIYLKRLINIAFSSERFHLVNGHVRVGTIPT